MLSLPSAIVITIVSRAGIEPAHRDLQNLLLKGQSPVFMRSAEA